MNTRSTQRSPNEHPFALLMPKVVLRKTELRSSTRLRRLRIDDVWSKSFGKSIAKRPSDNYNESHECECNESSRRKKAKTAQKKNKKLGKCTVADRRRPAASTKSMPRIYILRNRLAGAEINNVPNQNLIADGPAEETNSSGPPQCERRVSPRLHKNKSNLFHSKVESRNISVLKSTLSKGKIQNKFKRNKKILKKRINRNGFVTENEPKNLLNAGLSRVKTRSYPISKRITNGIQNAPVGLQNLPAEMLTEIFVQLSSRERKNVKLVSKYWYETCNVFPILHSEKIICLGVYEPSKIIRTLIDSKLKYMNLEFRDTDFRVDRVQFWRRCGRKIRSLRFVNCHLTGRTIGRMLIYCNYLQEVSFKHTKNETWSTLHVSAELWENLIEDKIIAPSVTTLEVHRTDAYISDHIVNFMFKVFPNVKNFTLCCNSVIPTSDLSEVESILAQQYSKTKITHDGIRDILRRREHSFERLHIKLRPEYHPPTFWENFATDLVHTTRLKAISFDLFEIGNTNIIDLLARQECIEKIKCTVTCTPRSVQDLNGFLYPLLKCCPHLRHLQLKLSEYSWKNVVVKIDWAILNLLLKSRLETLYIKHGFFILDDNVTVFDSLPENHTLRFLNLSRSNKKLRVCFVQKFRNLKHLSFTPSFVDNEVIQDIWKYQTGLTSLELNCLNDCSDYGFTGCDEESRLMDESVTYSVRRLEKLEYLKILLECKDSVCTSKIFEHFYFPRLRFLNVSMWSSTTEFNSAFLKCVKNLTSLEGLRVFHEQHISYHAWTEVCGNLKKLRETKRDDSTKKFRQMQLQVSSHLVSKLTSLLINHETIEKSLQRRLKSLTSNRQDFEKSC